MKYNYQNFSSQIFPGFYESVLNPLCETCTFMGTDIPEGYYADYRDINEYMKDAAKLWWEVVDLNTDNKDEVELEFLSVNNIDSPKEYNFRTDRTNIDIDINMQKLCRYCFGTHSKEFDKYLHENWSNRDGFWSFVPNDIKRFKALYKDNIDVMIEFFLLQNCNFESVEMCVLEQIDSIVYEHSCLIDNKWKKWEFEYDSNNDCYKPVRVIA